MTGRTDQPERRCGTCTACCTIMAVPDLDAGGKAAGVKCGHVCSRGCRIYERRPQSCRDFACLWKQGLMPSGMRPDHLGAVAVTGRFQGHECVMLHADPKRPRHWRRSLPKLQDIARGGVPVVVGVNALVLWVIQPRTGEVSERETDDA